MLQEFRKARPLSLSPLKSKGDAGLTRDIPDGIVFQRSEGPLLGVGSSSGSMNSVLRCVGLLFSFDIIARRASPIAVFAARFSTISCSSLCRRSSASMSGSRFVGLSVAGYTMVIEEGESGVTYAKEAVLSESLSLSPKLPIAIL